MKKIPNFKKLVLFDVDGTLVQTTNASISIWMERVHRVFRDIYKPIPAFEIDAVNGKIERQYFWDFAQSVGISRQEFLEKYPQAKELFTRLFEELIQNGDVSFSRIDPAYEFAQQLAKHPNVSIGLITGNTKEAAQMKLSAVGFDVSFPVGGFGDEADTRDELVSLAIKKAGEHFSAEFYPEHTIVIGDTAHDIVAAKKAGARAVGVTTGFGGDVSSVAAMESVGADMVVSSLLDEHVRNLLEV